MTKRITKPARTNVRTLSDRELATATGGWGASEIDLKALLADSSVKQIGGSGLVIPGLT